MADGNAHRLAPACQAKLSATARRCPVCHGRASNDVGICVLTVNPRDACLPLFGG
jgi:predicted amidophosphoribosyltransferase